MKSTEETEEKGVNTENEAGLKRKYKKDALEGKVHGLNSQIEFRDPYLPNYKILCFLT